MTTQETKQNSSMKNQKFAYWSSHDYHRMTVELVGGFCGWESLIALINLTSNPRNQAFLTAMFLTGGRVREVLNLRASNFTVNKEANLLEVSSMMLEKRYNRVYLDAEHKHWKTIKLKGKKRNAFPVRLDEPLTHLLLAWINEHKLSDKNRDDLLFESSWRTCRGKPLTDKWAYKLIRQLDKEMSSSLREALGLNKPLFDEETGEKIKDRLNLWNHWFRSQRACCLASEFGFDVVALVDYFNWEGAETALHYSRLGSKKLAEKMNEAKLSDIRI